MSTHGHRGVTRFFLGSVTDRVIRAGQTPVLVVSAWEASWRSSGGHGREEAEDFAQRPEKRDECVSL